MKTSNSSLEMIVGRVVDGFGEDVGLHRRSSGLA